MMATEIRPQDLEMCHRCGKAESRSRMWGSKGNRLYCTTCSFKVNLCEICGSTIPENGQTPEDQIHFDDWCFK